MILERLIWTILLAAVAVAICRTVRWWQGRRVAQAAVELVSADPTLLYFRADSCAVCPTQGRFVEEAVAKLGHRPLTVHTIDAERDAPTAARYGIISLPTTIVLDGRGTVKHINYGLTYAHKLVRQLEEI